MIALSFFYFNRSVSIKQIACNLLPLQHCSVCFRANRDDGLTNFLRSRSNKTNKMKATVKSTQKFIRSFALN